MGADDDVSGAVLTISISANKDVHEDQLGIDYDTGVIFEEGFIEGGAVYIDERYVGYVGQEGGALGESIVVVFQDGATPDDIARVIHATTYTNIDQDDPSPLTRTLTFAVAFPSGAQATANVFVNVVPVLDVNDPPVVDMDTTTDGVSGAATYVEDAAAVVLAPHASVVDSDSPDINGGSLTISVTNANANDQLRIQHQGFGYAQIGIEDSSIGSDGQPHGTLSESGIIFATFAGGLNGTPLVISFLPANSVAQAYSSSLQPLYRAITYSNTSQLPPAQRTVTFTVNDGDGADNGGNPITVSTVAVAIASVNDAPVVDLNGPADGTGATLAYTENGAAARIAPAATVTDDNTAKFNGGTLTIAFADGGTAFDQLTIGQGPEQVGVEWGIGGVGSDSGAITIGGAIISTFNGGKNGAPLVINFFPEGSLGGFTSLATVQTILRSIAYSNTSENPSTAPRTVTYTLIDGQGTANGGHDTTIATATVNVTATPDAPVAVADTLSIVAGQTTTYTVSQLLANDRDPDGDAITVTSVTSVAGGTASLSNGIVTFTPSTGAASFRYTISDPGGLTSTALVTLNQAPKAVTDTLGALVNSPVTYTTYNLIRNDTDLESNALTITGVSGASHGTVVLNANGTVTFTPDANYTGAASFQYTITDGFGSTTGTANVTVRASNANPVAVADTVSGAEDTNITVPLTILNNDSDSDGGFLVIQSVYNATHGTATLLTNGTVRFTPAANFNGPAGFDYVLSDSQGGTATAHVTVNVTPVNDPPIGNTDTVTTLEDTPITLSWDTLLANDTDVDLDTLVITAVNTANNGTVTLNTSARTVTFTPGVDYSTGRAFGFRYNISDQHGGTSSAAVVVNVTPVNDAPSGVDHKVGLSEARTYVFTATDFSAGFSDSHDLAPFNAGLNNFAGVVITTLPGTGTLYYDADGAGGAAPVQVTSGQFVSAADLAAGKLSYAADPNAIVNPTFKFQVRDDGGTANGGQDTDQTPNTMEVALTLANDAPRVDLNGTGAGLEVTAAYSIGSTGVTIAPNATLIDDNPSFGGGSLTISVGGLSFGDRLYVGEDSPGITLLGSQVYYNDDLIGRIANDQGTSLSISLYAPATGEAVQALIRSIGYDGTNVFDTSPRELTFELVDGGGTDNGGVDGTSVIATINFNNPPVPDSTIHLNGSEDVPIVFATADILANAYDPDGDTFAIVRVYNDGYGTPVLSADGSTITFTPQANYNGPASFSYDVRDSQGGITHVTVNGTIAPVADDPIARTDVLSAQQGAPTTFQASQLLSNDTDPDLAGPIRITAVHSGDSGSVVLNNDGTITFTPNGSALGVVDFTYDIADSNGGVASGTAHVTVKKLLTAPEDATVTYSVADLLGTALDANGQAYVIDSVSPVSGGSVTLNQNGTVSFVSSRDFNGRANFDFVMHDGGGHSIVGGALVDVTATPDNPILYPVAFYAPKDQSYTYTAEQLLGSSYDPDGTPLTIASVSGATHGTAVLNGDGSVTFTGAAGYEGAASFGFTVTDGNGGSSNSTASLTVLRALSGTEDQGSYFTQAQITGVSSSSNFSLGFDFNGGDFQRVGSTVQFTPYENFYGLASVDYAATISGQRVSGRVLVNVAPVNDAPFAQSSSATIVEDATHVFSAADFHFTDVEHNALAAVIVTSVPGSGTLWLDSDGAGGADPVQVTNGAVIARAQIDAGHLTYTPAANANGAATFSFKVQDNGGLANGGQDTSPSASTFTFNITAVNDAPVVRLDDASAGAAAQVLEGASVAIAPHAVVLDIDSANLAGGALTVSISDPESGDRLAIAQSETSGGLHLVGSDVVIDGVAIGSWSGGSAGANLVVSLGAQSTPALVQQLLGAIQYTTLDDTPPDARTITIALTDGDGGESVHVTSAVTIAAVDDPVSAAADLANVAENATVVIDARANDTDVDGGVESIVSIDGKPITAGGTVTLDSGATVKLNSDGTLTYNPNGKYVSLVSTATAAATGATNDHAIETFAYALSGGGSASVNVTVTGVDNAGNQLGGGSGNDVLTGTGGADIFNLSRGGSDTAHGGNGADGFYLGGAWDAGDVLDGGAGLDQIGVQGSTTVVLGASSMTGVEQLVFLPGSDTRFGDLSGAFYSYDVKTHDANVAAGQTLTVQANTLRVGESLTFDGSAETDGSFIIYGGLGADHLTGGQQTDGFYFGVDRFGADDTLDGQGGAADQLGLQGDFTGARAVVFGAGQLNHIEMIVLLSGTDARFGGAGSGFSYTLTMNDANAVSGSLMTIQANTLQASEVLTLDASAEHDASYRVYGGAGADSIIGGDRADEIWGGAGNDTITGGTGADQLHGANGNDRFIYLNVGDSTTAARDRLYDFTHGDVIDLSGAGLQSFHAGGFTHTAGEVTASWTGSLWLVQGDADGNGTADLSIEVAQTANFQWSDADFAFASVNPNATSTFSDSLGLHHL